MHMTPQVQTFPMAIGQNIRPVYADGYLYVMEGGVEVYANTDDGRLFLAEVPVGGLFVAGIGLDGSITVIATAKTVLRVYGHEEIRSLCGDERACADIAGGMDAWFSALSEGIAKIVLRRPNAVTLTPGQEVQVEEPTSITSSFGPLWVHAPWGEGTRYLDVISPTASNLFLLTPHTWLTVQEGTVQARATTAELMDMPEVGVMFGEFTATLVSAARTMAATFREQETERAEARDEKTEEDLQTAKKRFKGILSTERQRSRGDTDFAFVYQQIVKDKPTPQSVKETSGHFEHFASLNSCRLRSIRLEGKWWKEDKGPLVCTVKETGQLVAVKPDWWGDYRLHARGERSRKVTAAVARTLEREARIIVAPLPNKELRVRDILWIGLRLCLMDLSTLTMATLGASLLGLVVPLATGIMIDTFIPGAMRQQTLLLGIALVVVQLCSAALKMASSYCQQRMNARVAERISSGVMDRVMRLPTSSTRKLATVDLAMRVNAVDNARNAIMGVVLNALMSGITGLTGVFVLLYYSPLAGAIAAGLIALIAIVGSLSAMKQLKAFSEGEAMTASVYTLTQQIIENITVLRAFAAERRAFARWAQNSAEMRARGLRARNVSNLFSAFTAAYQILAVAVIFGVLGFTMGDQSLSTGELMVFVSTFQNFLNAGMTLARGANQLIGMKPSLKRAEPILKTLPETAPNAKSPGELSGAIEVSNVAFAHEGGVKVFDSVSFRVSPGSFVGIVGPSGCGKSTLLSLLVGFEKPDNGAVLYDGKDLAGLELSYLRKQIGMVRQNGRLFAGSLLENILGAKRGDIKDAWKAAELSGIADDIRALPMGMHTVVTEGAAAFSGGQVQRILLARAIVGKPKLLMLDEATSALDNVSQAAIAKNIDSLGATRVVVAHRLSSIRHADIILFIDKGRVQETGKYDELIERGGQFAQFAARQTL